MDLTEIMEQARKKACKSDTERRTTQELLDDTFDSWRKTIEYLKYVSNNNKKLRRENNYLKSKIQIISKVSSEISDCNDINNDKLKIGLRAISKFTKEVLEIAEKED
jgi:hypothetical protein